MLFAQFPCKGQRIDSGIDCSSSRTTPCKPLGFLTQPIYKYRASIRTFRSHDSSFPPRYSVAPSAYHCICAPESLRFLCLIMSSWPISCSKRGGTLKRAVSTLGLGFLLQPIWMQVSCIFKVARSSREGRKKRQIKVKN